MEKNKFTILIPTPIHPKNRSLRIDFISLVKEKLGTKSEINILWFLYQPEPLQTNNSTSLIFDIHNYRDAIEAVEEIKPDCIMVNFSLEPIQYSLSIAAKICKIPLISFYLEDYDTRQNYSQPNIFKKIQKLSNILFSNKVPTFSQSKTKPFFRSRFILYKKFFLINTINSKKYIKNKILFEKNKSKKIINDLPDLHLICFKSWIAPLQSLGIHISKIKLIGNPIWDLPYEYSNIKKQKIKSNINSLNVLVVTDSLVEHGDWSEKKRDVFLTSLLTELTKSNSITFSLKIHPSSENIEYYEQLLKKLNINAKIYQNEYIWKLIESFDIVVSYGYTTTHTELACGEIKQILIQSDIPPVKLELIDAAISTGLIKVHHDSSNLIQKIKEFYSQPLELNQKYLLERNDLTGGFNGDSAKQASETILKFIKNNHLE